MSLAIWKPSRVKAKDGKEYWVFTLFATGRGWYQRRHYTLLDDAYREIQVDTLEYDADFKRVHNKGIEVELLSNYSFEVVDFSVNPYTRKDGTFECKKMITTGDGVLWAQPFYKIYGIHHYTKKPTERKNYEYWPVELMRDMWYGEKVYAQLDRKDEVFLVEVEPKQLHAV